MTDVLVMAGGSKSEPLTEQEGVTNKAFIPINGKPLLAYILEGISRAPSVNKIVVVGPEEGLRAMQQTEFSFTIVPESGTMLENAAAGLNAVDPEQLCIVATGDIPLLDENVVEDFLKLCKPFDADFYYPILTRESCESRFPETKRTYVRLQEGTFTGGNMVLLRPSWFFQNRHRLETFIVNRKKPLKLLRMLPLTFLIKFICRRLTVADLEKKLSQLMMLQARAVPCELVAIGTDVDKLSDLAVVREALSDRDKNC
jgi:GTP:adenosylcobinamide-phosphate guanylyltransferase